MSGKYLVHFKILLIFRAKRLSCAQKFTNPFSADDQIIIYDCEKGTQKRTINR